MNSTANRMKAWPLTLLAGIALGWGANVWWDHHHGEPAKTSEASPVAPKAALYWYDPMVPNQHFDKPGKSPFMDMQLVPKYADEAEGAASQAPGVSVDGRVAQSLGLRLAKAEMRDLSVQVHAVGTVQLNERDVSLGQAKSSGFVQRGYGRAPGDVVAQGAPLVDLLMPDWAGAQAEYLAVKRTGDASLASAARQRLAWLGMPPGLIDHVDQTGQTQTAYTVTAPIAGVIQELVIRPGMTVTAGMSLARLNGIDTVWVDVAVPEGQAATVKPGQAATGTLAAYPGEMFKGTVNAVLPEGNRDSRTLKVRVVWPNRDGRLKAGMTAQVALTSTPRHALVIPAEAVIRTGQRTLVYVAEASEGQQAGRYRPVAVQLGEESQGLVEVLEGLNEGQQVVASGPFLIDSEASLQGIALAPVTPLASSPASTPPSMPQAVSASINGGPVYEGIGRIDELKHDEVTLTHEPIPALKWPGMTMPFALRHGAAAATLHVGDQVRFRFTNGDEGPVIQSLQPIKGGQP